MPKPKAAKAAAPAPTIAAAPAAEFAEIRHSAIRPDPANPRKYFDDDGLGELAASIARDGLLEPLVVRQLDDEPDAYMLIAGERRWRAIGQAVFAGAWSLDQLVPVMVRDVSEEDARRLALIENLQRRDLNPLEEARAIEALQQLTGVSAAQLGRDLGFSERWAQQRLSLLKLPEALQNRVDRGELKVEEARAAAAIWDKLPPIKQKELERGASTVQQVKQWLDNKPKPLSEAAQLAICELLEKAEAEGFTPPNSYSDRKSVRIAFAAPPAAFDPDEGEDDDRVVEDSTFSELASRYLIEGARILTIEDVKTAEHYTSPTYQTEWTLRDVLPAALKAETRQRLVGELRVKLFGLQVDHDLTQSGRFATAWLNAEPIELTAEQQAEIAANRAARETREAEQSAARQAEDRARTEAHQARLARITRSAAAEASGEVSTQAGASALAAELARPLPWFLDEQLAMILDATGAAVTDRPWNGGPELLGNLRLVVALANAAGGMQTPTERPVPPVPMDPDAMPRGDFVAAVAAQLVAGDERSTPPSGRMDEVSAGEMAATALKLMLAEDGMVYGEADTWDWNADGALSLADAVRRGEYTGSLPDDDDAQIDPEEALQAGATTEDDAEEFSPALRALAGGGGEAREIVDAEQAEEAA